MMSRPLSGALLRSVLHVVALSAMTQLLGCARAIEPDPANGMDPASADASAPDLTDGMSQSHPDASAPDLADGMDPASADASTPDVLGMPGMPWVACGPRVCSGPTPVCCDTIGYTDNGRDLGGCAAPDAICSSDIWLECDGPEDCAPLRCMGEPLGSGVRSRCSSQRNVYDLCHDRTQCPSSAPHCCPIDTNQFSSPLGYCSTNTIVGAGACD